jgi:hypothetical protein
MSLHNLIEKYSVVVRENLEHVEKLAKDCGADYNDAVRAKMLEEVTRLEALDRNDVSDEEALAIDTVVLSLLEGYIESKEADLLSSENEQILKDS